MFVPGDQRQVMLPSRRRNPGVIDRNHLPRPFQLDKDLRVDLAGRLGHANHTMVGQLLIDSLESGFRPVCLEHADEKFGHRDERDCELLVPKNFYDDGIAAHEANHGTGVGDAIHLCD